MSERPTDALLRELTGDLKPVRPIARLRSVGLIALVACAAMAGANALLTGWPLPFLGAGLPSREGSFLLTLGGLALAAAGALSAALAGAVPGRDVTARAGCFAAVAGVAVASGGAVWWLLTAGVMEPVLPLGSCIGCASHALMLALAPALVVGLFLGRALVRRPLALSAFAATGALMLGAWLVHASCRDGGALHVALGHVAAPLLLAAVLTLPLAWWARQCARTELDAPE